MNLLKWSQEPEETRKTSPLITPPIRWLIISKPPKRATRPRIKSKRRRTPIKIIEMTTLRTLSTSDLMKTQDPPTTKTCWRFLVPSPRKRLMLMALRVSSLTSKAWSTAPTPMANKTLNSNPSRSMKKTKTFLLYNLNWTMFSILSDQNSQSSKTIESHEKGYACMCACVRVGYFPLNNRQQFLPPPPFILILLTNKIYFAFFALSCFYFGLLEDLKSPLPRIWRK